MAVLRGAGVLDETQVRKRMAWHGMAWHCLSNDSVRLPERRARSCWGCFIAVLKCSAMESVVLSHTSLTHSLS